MRAEGQLRSAFCAPASGELPLRPHGHNRNPNIAGAREVQMPFRRIRHPVAQRRRNPSRHGTAFRAPAQIPSVQVAHGHERKRLPSMRDSARTRIRPTNRTARCHWIQAGREDTPDPSQCRSGSGLTCGAAKPEEPPLGHRYGAGSSHLLRPHPASQYMLQYGLSLPKQRILSRWSDARKYIRRPDRSLPNRVRGRTIVPGPPRPGPPRPWRRNRWERSGCSPNHHLRVDALPDEAISKKEKTREQLE